MKQLSTNKPIYTIRARRWWTLGFKVKVYEGNNLVLAENELVRLSREATRGDSPQGIIPKGVTTKCSPPTV